MLVSVTPNAEFTRRERDNEFEVGWNDGLGFFAKRLKKFFRANFCLL
jgi:hypothetical protein